MTRNDFLFCLITLLCFMFVYLASDIYLPAMPVLRGYFGVNAAAIQSTIGIYMLGAMLAQLFAGPIADHIGFKQTAIPCCILLVIATAICASSTSLLVLNTGRLLQAISAGSLSVVGRGSLARYFPAEQATKLYLVISPLCSLSPALAPIIGGYITHISNWRFTFIFLIVLAAILLLGLIYKYPIGKHENVETSLHPIFILKTYKNLFVNAVFSSYLTLIFFCFLIYNAYIAEAPFILHNIGYSAKAIGLAYFPVAIPFFLCSQIMRKLNGKFSSNTFITFGVCGMLIGTALMFFISLHPIHYAYQVYLPMVIITGAIGFITPVAFSQGILLFPKTTGYTSSVLGGTGLIGGAVGAQTVDIITHGSLMRLAIFFAILIAVSFLTFIGFQRRA